MRSLSLQLGFESLNGRAIANEVEQAFAGNPHTPFVRLLDLDHIHPVKVQK
jgi:hypothetical protein